MLHRQLVEGQSPAVRFDKRNGTVPGESWWGTWVPPGESMVLKKRTVGQGSIAGREGARGYFGTGGPRSGRCGIASIPAGL